MRVSKIWRDVPIPDRMKHLGKDDRGFPVPYIVMKDVNGRPHFTINETPKVNKAFRKDLCSICGAPLTRGRWFIGGPLSAFHPNGAYIDPPTHRECANYALQVCPYLAAPRYSKRLDGSTWDFSANPSVVAMMDTTADPERPEVFVAVMSVGSAVNWQQAAPKVIPRRPYREVQYWMHGERMPDEEGAAISARIVREMLLRETKVG